MGKTNTPKGHSIREFIQDGPAQPPDRVRETEEDRLKRELHELVVEEVRIVSRIEVVNRQLTELLIKSRNIS